MISCLDYICLYTYAVMKYHFYFYFFMEEGACEGTSVQGPQKMGCSPGWVAQVFGASSCTPKACRFDPWSGRIWEATSWCLSLTSMFLSLPSSLFKVNNYVLSWGFKKIMWCTREAWSGFRIGERLDCQRSPGICGWSRSQPRCSPPPSPQKDKTSSCLCNCVAKYSSSFAEPPSFLLRHIEPFSCLISVGGGGSQECLRLVDGLWADAAGAQSEAECATVSARPLWNCSLRCNEKVELQIKSGLLRSAPNSLPFQPSLPIHFKKPYYLFMTQSSWNNMHLTCTCNCYPINYSVKSHRSGRLSPSTLLKSWQRGAALDKFIN